MENKEIIGESQTISNAIKLLRKHGYVVQKYKGTLVDKCASCSRSKKTDGLDVWKCKCGAFAGLIGVNDYETVYE